MSDPSERILASIENDFAGEPAPIDTAEGTSSKRPQASELVALALENYRLGRATTGEPFAYRPLWSPAARMLRGGRDSLRAELACRYSERFGRAPSASALADAMLVLEGQAQREAPTPLALRVAQHDDNLFIDLANDDGDVVIVSRDGWRLQDVELLPVLFRRTALTGPLPVPVQGGKLGELRRFLNVTDNAWPLIVGWLVAALLPDIPKPVLLLDGEQGSAKTTSAKTVVNLIDPSPAPLRSSPKDPEEWAVVAAGSWVVGIDNVRVEPRPLCAYCTYWYRARANA